MTLNKPLDTLFEAWRALPCPDGCNLPPRRALRLRAVSDILPRLSLLRRSGRYDVTACLIGTAVEALWDRPVTGMNAFDLTAPSMRENVAKIYEAILDHPCGLMIKECVKRRGLKALDVSTLFLPMCDRLGIPTYIIGCTVYQTSDCGRVLLEHLVTKDRQLAGLEFLDIGDGIPELEFDMPSAHPALQEAHPQTWWRRLLSERIPHPQQNDRKSRPQ